MVKIGDFGVSKRMSANTQKMGNKTILGTPYYLSPEICQGLPYNEKSDVWSMGCCLYEMATLRKAFDAPNFAALITRIISVKVLGNSI
jgi:NIMA (never in mitosis gene a)-related kinase